MPTYDYHCEANGRTVEVKHPMSDKLRTWGELCALAGLPLDTTPAETPIAKQLAATNIAGGAKAGSVPAASGAAMGGGCGSGACGHRH